MKKVCLTVLCILLVGCGNAETAETEEKMRFENLDPAKVNMQYGGLKEWDRFYNSFYEQKEGSDLIVLGTVEGIIAVLPGELRLQPIFHCGWMTF